MLTHGSNQRKTGLIRKLKALFWVSVLGLSGCVYSMHPWHQAGQGSADPALLGLWRDVEDGATWVFAPQGDSLSVLYQGEKELAHFNGASFQLQGQSYLDLAPADGSCGDGVLAWYLLPLHGLQRWSLEQDTLRMSALKAQALDSLLNIVDHPAVDRSSDRWVFTGTREEMAAFLAGNLLDAALYDSPTVLVRP